MASDTSFVAMEHSTSGLQAHKLNNDTEVAFYRARLAQLWADSGGHALFPGCSPVSLERRHLGAVAKSDYMASLKADGVRYILMMTTDDNDDGIGLLINRKFEMYEVCIWGPTEFFRKGTILDTEMVQSSGGNNTLLVFDTVLSAGNSFTQRSYSHRMEEARRIVTSQYPDESTPQLEERILTESCISVVNSDDFCVKLLVKPYVPMKDLDRMWAGRHSSPFHFDGIVLTPEHCGVQSGTHNTMFKWKPIHTIDILVCRTGAAYSMFFGTPPNIIDAAVDPLVYRGRDQKCHFMSNVVTDRLADSDWKRVVECTCDIDSPNGAIYFTPVKVRWDKEYGNGLTTTTKTLDNIQENIKVGELIDVARCLAAAALPNLPNHLNADGWCHKKPRLG